MSLQEGDVLSGRVDALELPGAEFRQVRCIVHLPPPPSSSSKIYGSNGSGSGSGSGGGRMYGGGGFGATSAALPHAPPDLQLSFRASGLIGADVFRGVKLVLDLANSRFAVCQHQAPVATPGSRGGW